MNDLEYTLQLIAQRYGGKLKKVVSEPFNVTFEAWNGDIDVLAQLPGIFYYIKGCALTVAGIPDGNNYLLFQSNAGSFLPGQIILNAALPKVNFLGDFETDLIQYVKGTSTTGDYRMSGICYKVTYGP